MSILKTLNSNSTVFFLVLATLQTAGSNADVINLSNLPSVSNSESAPLPAGDISWLDGGVGLVCENQATTKNGSRICYHATLQEASGTTEYRVHFLTPKGFGLTDQLLSKGLAQMTTFSKSESERLAALGYKVIPETNEQLAKQDSRRNSLESGVPELTQRIQVAPKKVSFVKTAKFNVMSPPDRLMVATASTKQTVIYQQNRERLPANSSDSFSNSDTAQENQ